MFTRLLRSLNLPAASGKVQVNRHSNSYDSTAVVNWITSLMVTALPPVLLGADAVPSGARALPKARLPP